MLFLEALKKYPTNLEQVLLPLFPSLINKLVQLTTEAEVRYPTFPQDCCLVISSHMFMWWDDAENEILAF